MEFEPWEWKELKPSGSAGLHCKGLEGLQRASGLSRGPQVVTEGFQAKAKPCSWERALGVGSVAGEGMATQETHFPGGVGSPVLLEWWLCLFGDQEAGRLARAQSRKPPVEVRAESKAFSQGYHRLLVWPEGPVLPRAPQMG